MNVSNRRCIRHLSFQSMKGAKTRNLIATLAIALTTVLFTSLFTIAMSINYSFEQSNFRQCGGFSHGTFKGLTEEQFNKLKADELIKEYGLRRVVGMPSEEPFNKTHVEIGYSDANQAGWMFCDPKVGKLPSEGTKEAATDTKVLSLLGIEPKLGTEFTITFSVDGTKTTETFILSGWWEYDEAIVANHVLIPQSRAEEIFHRFGTKGTDGITGLWNMDVMFKSSLQIERDMKTVLENHGYQNEQRTDENNYIQTGVNWGYTGSQFAKQADPLTMISIAGLLLLIIFTGYLIIYNVFQISVSGDIRFYGLLKTIGTTGRQLRRIILIQALTLSLVGIPIGLLLGFGLGSKLTPIVLSTLNGASEDAVSTSPLIFIGSAIFALITVLISCLKPGRLAAKVSPVEAVRFTEGKTSKKGQRKAKQRSLKVKSVSRKSQSMSQKTKKGASVTRMAWANLGRSKSKTTITIISLSLAVVLLNMTVTFTNGFDMDKYISNMVADFIVADAGYFQAGIFGSNDNEVSKEVIDTVKQQEGISSGGLVYRQSSPVEEFVTEDYYRKRNSAWNDEQTLDAMVDFRERNEDGLLVDAAQLYGMERYAMDKMIVLDGDLSKLYQPGGRYVAAVYFADDYGNPIEDSHWAKLGDKITLRYVTDYEYYDPNTGEILSTEQLTEEQPYRYRAKKYQEIDYEVAATICIPHTLSYRYYGSDEFVMNDQTFIQDSGTSSVMYYAFDTTDEGNALMEGFLSDLTTKQMTQYDYESKETYAKEFESFRSMFLILGGILCFIIALVGILNFVNAILTGILTRRREFAVLQSIGMTGKQLKTMLVCEGLYYALGAVAVSMILSIAAGPLLSTVFGNVFWFFTYKFTILPVLCVAPFFAIMGVLLPLIMYHYVSRHSIVERLREIE